MDESPERRPSFYTLTDNITHIIPSRRFPRQEFRRLNRPFAENSAGVSAVLKCDDFVSSREDHVMITHDGAATNSRDTDFAAFALLTLLASVIYIVICSVRCLIDGVCPVPVRCRWVRPASGCGASLQSRYQNLLPPESELLPSEAS